MLLHCAAFTAVAWGLGWGELERLQGFVAEIAVDLTEPRIELGEFDFKFLFALVQAFLLR